MLRSLEIRDNYALRQIPSIYSFPMLEEAHLTYAYHCCSFRYPKTHDPSAYEKHKRDQEELNARCESKRRQANSNDQQKGLTTAQSSSSSSTTTTTTDSITANVRQNEPTSSEQIQAANSFHGDSFDNLGQFDSTAVRVLTSHQFIERAINKPHQQGFSNNKPAELEEGEWHLLNASGGVGLETTVFHINFNGSYIDCGELVQKASGHQNISCTPEPDAFNPCEDIMGYPVLRVAVWFVVAASVLGNLSVIVVQLGIFRRLSVPKFLQLNLAIGDLFMGVYLAMLAAADLITVGTYFNYAIDWQHGLGCRLAGAASLFASQLSIFTLSVITFERYYTITYSIDLNMRLQLGWASRIMLVGWIYAFTSAMLPIFANINSYSKTSICLPMRTIYKTDRLFIATLLIVDSLAFLIIFICYLKMYLLILRQKSEATRKERTVARRMALLVFTDFACWAPIIFFGATAVLGKPLISVTNSKILIVFFYPLNSMANPFLYALSTLAYRRDFNYVVGRWRQWRVNLFKNQNDRLSFSYNNHPNHPYGVSQYPVGSHLNAHLGAVAAVTGVANHLRHYKVPINGQNQKYLNCNDADLELIRSSNSKMVLARSQEPSQQSGSDLHQQKLTIHNAPGRLINGSPQGSSGSQFIIRHTILSDKCIAADGRAFSSSKTSNRHRVNRVLKQRVVARCEEKRNLNAGQIEDQKQQLVAEASIKASQPSEVASKLVNFRKNNKSSKMEVVVSDNNVSAENGKSSNNNDSYIVMIDDHIIKKSAKKLTSCRFARNTDETCCYRTCCRSAECYLGKNEGFQVSEKMYSSSKQLDEQPTTLRIECRSMECHYNDRRLKCNNDKEVSKRLRRRTKKRVTNDESRQDQATRGCPSPTGLAPTGSSSQATNEPFTSTTTETTEQTSTSCKNSSDFGFRIIPRIITTENDSMAPVQINGGQVCLSTIESNNNGSSGGRTKQNGLNHRHNQEVRYRGKPQSFKNSLEVCARHHQRRQHRHIKPNEQQDKEISENISCFNKTISSSRKSSCCSHQDSQIIMSCFECQHHQQHRHQRHRQRSSDQCKLKCNNINQGQDLNKDVS